MKKAKPNLKGMRFEITTLYNLYFDCDYDNPGLTSEMFEKYKKEKSLQFRPHTSINGFYKETVESWSWHPRWLEFIE